MGSYMVTAKHIKSSFKFVQGTQRDYPPKIYWHVNMSGVARDSFPTERDAAIAADKILIKRGKEPVNILKRK